MEEMTSGNGGQDNSNNPSFTPNSVKKTYANAVSPQKEEAIVIDSIEGLSNDDYLDGLEELIPIEEVRFISKISGKRVCVFLTSKSLVGKLEGKTIKVQHHVLPIRPLIEKNKRVVISNVYPMIPHELLIDQLKKIGIIPVSQMHYIRAGLNKRGRAHVLSFRRQVYIKQDDANRLPENFQVNYDNTTYWVYLSTDSTSCFLCKQTGHVAKQCPDQETELEDASFTPIKGKENETEQFNKNDTPDVPNTTQDVTMGTKRPPPSSSTSENSSLNQPKNLEIPAAESGNLVHEKSENNRPNTSFKLPRRPAKMQRLESTVLDNNTEEETLTVQQLIEKSPQLFALDHLQFQNFLKKSYGQANIVEIAREFTEDIEGLASMLDITSPHFNKMLKARCSRIKKKLLKAKWRLRVRVFCDRGIKKKDRIKSNN